MKREKEKRKINFVWLLTFAFVAAVTVSMIPSVQAQPPTPSYFNINCFEDAAHTTNANPDADWTITFTSEGVEKTWNKTHNSGTGEAANTVFYGTYQGKTNLYSKVLPADSGTTIKIMIQGYQPFTLCANPGHWIEGNASTPANRVLIPAYFDIGPGTYPSIFGTHTGNFTPKYDLHIDRMQTYACKGTGGHSEYVAFYKYKDGEKIAEGNWTGYQGNKDKYHYLYFNSSFVLNANVTYRYEIITGSYPQIHHNHSITTSTGTITCTEFIDANGKVYNDWIPAICLD